MKIQIKTLNQKSLLIDIEDTKTVFDLKKELSMYADVGVQPELQKLIYAGKILSNEDQLSVYNIDVKKFLVVMILKQPLIEEPPTTSISAKAATTTVTSPAAGNANESATTSADQFRSPAAQQQPTPAVTPSSNSKNTSLVENIVNMGYAEDKVRRALEASFDNPERAIEYLIEGIPTTPAAVEGAGISDADLTMSPFEMFRTDPVFQNLRHAIQQQPDLINDAIKRIGEANPAILSLINENQHEFISMLIDASDDEDGDDDDDDD